MSGNGNHATVKGASLTMMCQQQDVPFFFKQWGGINKKKTGRLLEGKIWDEMPFELKN